MFLSLSAETWGIVGAIAGRIVALGAIIAAVRVVVRWLASRRTKERAVPPGPDVPTTVAAPARAPLVRYFDPERYTANPLNVILESYLFIEGWFDELLTARGQDLRPHNDKLGVDDMAHIAVHDGLISPQSVETLRGLGILRQLSIDKGGDGVTAEEARKYVTMTDAIIHVMTGEVRKQ
jgi:hypothetical protein